jgi:hypothetical protein
MGLIKAQPVTGKRYEWNVTDVHVSGNTAWIAVTKNLLRILYPNVCVRLKQILTVDNRVFSLRHTLLNQSHTRSVCGCR